MPTPLRVTVTGAAGNIGYSLIYRIANGDLFGPNQPVILQLLEITPALPALNGVAMELEDCAFPLLADMVLTDDPNRAFKDTNWALLVGARPRSKGMERKDLLSANAAIFSVQGKAINANAASDIRVLVVGNPANTNCLIAMSNAPDVPAERFTAMTRLDHNRAAGQLAIKAGVPVSAVQKVTIWGNHSATQYPDAHHALINGQPAPQVISDAAWLKETFVPMVVEEDALSFTDAAPVLGDLETTPYPLASMTGGSLLSTPSFTFPSEEERPAETPATIIIEELKAKLNAETNLRHHYAALTENYRYVINCLTKDGFVSQQYLNYIAGFDTVE